MSRPSTLSKVSRVILEPCSPPGWARSGHAQTILGHLIPSQIAPSDLNGRLVEIPLPDGDRLVAKHLSGTGNTVLYLFHGLGSNIAASYMGRTAELGRKLGWDIYLVNHRGCGEGSGLARKPYHSGRGEDLAEVIRMGRVQHPGKKHMAIGFSLGANALLTLLSGLRGDVMPDSAIAVNGPIDLQNASTLLGQGLNRIYDMRFSIECRLDLRRRMRQGLEDREYRFPLLTNLRDFDEIYTSQASGFKDRADYYATCSTHKHLSAIQVPTVLLTAEDDPFIDYRDYANARLSPHVHLHIEKIGGHLGYLTSRKTPLGSNRWLDYALWEFMQALSD